MPSTHIRRAIRTQARVCPSQSRPPTPPPKPAADLMASAASCGDQLAALRLTSSNETQALSERALRAIDLFQQNLRPRLYVRRGVGSVHLGATKWTPGAVASLIQPSGAHIHVESANGGATPAQRL